MATWNVARPKKVAFLACMQKSLAILKNGTHWSKKLPEHLMHKHCHVSAPFEEDKGTMRSGCS